MLPSTVLAILSALTTTSKVLPILLPFATCQEPESPGLHHWVSLPTGCCMNSANERLWQDTTGQEDRERKRYFLASTQWVWQWMSSILLQFSPPNQLSQSPANTTPSPYRFRTEVVLASPWCLFLDGSTFFLGSLHSAHTLIKSHIIKFSSVRTFWVIKTDHMHLWGEHESLFINSGMKIMACY